VLEARPGGAYPPPKVVVLGGILGAILALAIVVVPGEWFYADEFSESTEVIISVVAATVGAFVGSRLARRFVQRRQAEGL
jgi:hypothetical protein